MNFSSHSITMFVFISFLILSYSSFNQKSTSFQLLSSEKESSTLNFISSDQSASSFSFENHNNGTAVLSSDNKDLITMNSYKDIIFNTKVVLDTPTIDFLMTYENSNFKIENENQWTLIALDDFQGSAPGWSKEKLSTCGTNDNMFLGGHCNLAGDEVHKVYTGLKSHTMIRITANFHFFDMWEGENAYMKFNNNTVWTDTYKWCDKVMQWRCRKFGINACGADYPDRMSVPIDFTANHNSEEFRIEFGANLNKSACEASWGIDDVAIYIK